MTVSDEYWRELIAAIKYLEEEKKNIDFSLRVLKQEQQVLASQILKKMNNK